MSAVRNVRRAPRPREEEVGGSICLGGVVGRIVQEEGVDVDANLLEVLADVVLDDDHFGIILLHDEIDFDGLAVALSY